MNRNSLKIFEGSLRMLLAGFNNPNPKQEKKINILRRNEIRKCKSCKFCKKYSKTDPYCTAKGTLVRPLDYACDMYKKRKK